MEEVADEPLYRDRVCGIDIGKAQMAATIRVPRTETRSRRMQETRTFGTTKREVQALADWLRSWQVPALVMEATGDYWKPVFYRLEAAGFECVLADARLVKNLPGRPKRDTSDSQWLAQNFERGAVRPCFVATPEFRVIRLHTRYRRELIEERTREKQRVEKLLESAAVELFRRAVGPARRIRPGHHGSPHRRRARPPGTGPAGTPPRPRQDPPAGAGPGRHRVLQPRARCPAGCHAAPHRRSERRHRPAQRRDRGTARAMGGRNCSRPSRCPAGSAVPPRTSSPRPART